MYMYLSDTHFIWKYVYFQVNKFISRMWKGWFCRKFFQKYIIGNIDRASASFKVSLIVSSNRIYLSSDRCSYTRTTNVIVKNTTIILRVNFAPRVSYFDVCIHCTDAFCLEYFVKRQGNTHAFTLSSHIYGRVLRRRHHIKVGIVACVSKLLRASCATK